MVVPHTYIILQARMGSERLPGKVMRKIKGIPMIGIQIQRLKQSGIPIILATSNHPENDILADYVQKIGLKVYRGSEDNVLERFYFAAKKHKASFIIRMTGDNPLTDGIFIRKTLNQIDYTVPRMYFSPGKSKTWPLGTSFELFSFELLQEAYNNMSNSREKEHVTTYMHQNTPGDIRIKTIARHESKAHYRLTVDTAQDFKLIKILVEKHSCELLETDEIIRVLDSNVSLTLINKDVKQKSI